MLEYLIERERLAEEGSVFEYLIERDWQSERIGECRDEAYRQKQEGSSVSHFLEGAPRGRQQNRDTWTDK